MSYWVNIGPQSWRPPDCRAWSLNTPRAPAACIAAGVCFPWCWTSQLPPRFTLNLGKRTFPAAPLLWGARLTQPPAGSPSGKTWWDKFAASAQWEGTCCSHPSSKAPLFLGPLAYSSLWYMSESQCLFVPICAQDRELSPPWLASSPSALSSHPSVLCWISAKSEQPQKALYSPLFSLPKPFCIQCKTPGDAFELAAATFHPRQKTAACTYQSPWPWWKVG